MLRNFFLAFLSGILLAVAWPTYGIPLFIFFAFVPLLILTHELNESNTPKKYSKLFFFSYLSFLLWNILTTHWLYNASVFGAVFAIGCNSIFFAIIFTAYGWALNRLPKHSAALFLVSFWMAFEKFHLGWDLSWPWLTLGNVFSESILWIQWYEYTGVFGGTLWIWLVNFWAFHAWQKRKLSAGSWRKQLARIVIGIALPIFISHLIYRNQEEANMGRISVVVLQPNLDPYQEKYSFTNAALLEKMISMTDEYLDEKTDYLLTPEGYFDEGFGLDLNRYQNQTFYASVSKWLTHYPQLHLLSGVQSYQVYPPNKKAPSPTANRSRNGQWYDVYNSAFDLSATEKDQVYHKSKLVPGVEFMPFKNTLEPFIGAFLLDFGGTIATRGIQKERTVFTHQTKGIKTAPIICYESIYGDFVTEYVRKGANFLSIITNDAWWDDTQGHKQLLSYARLRAIETRRAIARSANTGISAFINTKGELVKTMKYNTGGALKAEIPVNDKITFYTRYGDVLAGWASLFFLLSGAIALSGRLKNTRKS